jgi:hypothetical protein
MAKLCLVAEAVAGEMPRPSPGLDGGVAGRSPLYRRVAVEPGAVGRVCRAEARFSSRELVWPI